VRDSSRWIGTVLVVASLCMFIASLIGAPSGAWATIGPASKVLSVVAFILVPALVAARAGLWRLAAPGPGSRLLLASLVGATLGGAISLALPFTLAGYAQVWEPGGLLFQIDAYVVPALGAATNLFAALGVLRSKLAPRGVALLGLVSVTAWAVSQVGIATALGAPNLGGLIIWGGLAFAAQFTASAFVLALGLGLLPRTSDPRAREAGTISQAVEVAPAPAEPSPRTAAAPPVERDSGPEASQRDPRSSAVAIPATATTERAPLGDPRQYYDYSCSPEDEGEEGAGELAAVNFLRAMDAAFDPALPPWRAIYVVLAVVFLASSLWLLSAPHGPGYGAFVCGAGVSGPVLSVFAARTAGTRFWALVLSGYIGANILLPAERVNGGSLADLFFAASTVFFLFVSAIVTVIAQQKLVAWQRSATTPPE
jgi:hypothetical protein